MPPRSQTPPVHGRPPGSTDIGVGPFTEVPVPEKAMTWGLFAAESRTVSVPVREPVASRPELQPDRAGRARLDRDADAGVALDEVDGVGPAEAEAVEEQWRGAGSVTVIVWAGLVVPTATGPKLADSAVNVATGAVVGGGGVPPPPPPPPPPLPLDATAPPVPVARMSTTAARTAAMRDPDMTASVNPVR